jgi:tRNA dimethylallyltransferase
MNNSGKILIIGGPTASGKTEISFKIAKEINGEIISADSRQFYKEINIGTDKPPIWMRNEIPHHFVDFFILKRKF